jgi:hypothetical protein
MQLPSPKMPRTTARDVEPSSELTPFTIFHFQRRRDSAWIFRGPSSSSTISPAGLTGRLAQPTDPSVTSSPGPGFHLRIFPAHMRIAPIEDGGRPFRYVGIFVLLIARSLDSNYWSS